MTYNYNEWLKNPIKIFCKCGCNKQIIVLQQHKIRGIPEYIFNHNKIGTKHSKETLHKMSISGKSKHLSVEAKNKMLMANKGKKRSEETKKKISEANKGKKRTQESKIKYSECQKGNKHWLNKHHSEETKIKMSKSQSGEKNAMFGKTGEKNPNWRGGVSFEPYCFKFNTKLKERVRERDNYQCQYPSCLCTQLENMILYQHILNIHHIHYDKTNCNPDLITLCNKHNSVVNFNRDYWENYFMNKLKKIS